MDEKNVFVTTEVLRLVHLGDLTFADVITKLSQSNLDEASVKAAVFRLSSEGKIEITPEWMIRRADTSHR